MFDNITLSSAVEVNKRTLTTECDDDVNRIFTLAARQQCSFGVATVGVGILKARMSDVTLGVQMSSRVDDPHCTAWLCRVRIAVTTVYIMIRININIIMILWRYFIVSKHHTYVLQSLTTFYDNVRDVDAHTISKTIPSPVLICLFSKGRKRFTRKVQVFIGYL